MNVLAVNYSRGIDDAWSKFATFVPKFLGFLIILVIGYFVAKAIEKILAKVLERVGFDRAVERGGVKQVLDRSKYDASDILGRIVFYAVLLIVLQLAFGVFGPNAVSAMLAGIVRFLPRVFAAVVILVIAAAIAAVVKEVIEASLGELGYAKLFAGAASIAILVFGVFAALNEIQIAPAIVNGLFYAILAIIVGSAVIAIGGGGIVPMRRQWDKAIGRLEEEAPRLRDESRGAKDRIAARADELKQKAQTAPTDGRTGSTRNP